MGGLISSFLFQPPVLPTPLNQEELFWLCTSFGSRIPAVFIRQPKARYTILYAHGNAEDLGMIYDYLFKLSQLLHVNIMGFDYTGYGLGALLTENKLQNVVPSEKHCYADIEAAFKYLTCVENIPTKRIILFGRSVGSGPCCYLAQKVKIKQLKEMNEQSQGPSGDNKCTIPENSGGIGGLILHSPFLSVCRVVVDTGFTWSTDVFPNVNRIKDVGCPTYIIHGTNDEIVPFSHGLGLFNALPQKCRYTPFWVQGLGHNSIEVERASSFVKRLQKFVTHVARTERATSPTPIVSVIESDIEEDQTSRDDGVSTDDTARSKCVRQHYTRDRTKVRKSCRALKSSRSAWDMEEDKIPTRTPSRLRDASSMRSTLSKKPKYRRRSVRTESPIGIVCGGRAILRTISCSGS